MPEQVQVKNTRSQAQPLHNTNTIDEETSEPLGDLVPRALELNSDLKRRLISKLQLELSDSGSEGEDEQTPQKTSTETDLEGRIYRSNGTIYIATEHWTKYYTHSQFCHLFVSTTSEAIARRLKRASADQPSEKEGPGRPNLPDRFKIVNEALKDEMSSITGIEDYNHDHVIPYRSIIPFERAIRQAYEDKDKQFQKWATKKGMRTLTQQQEEALEYAMFIEYSCSVTYRKDEKLRSFKLRESVPPEWRSEKVAVLKHLRDGLRELVRLLDTDLKELVATYREIANGTYKFNELPFSHLWYLFQPGAEIISTKPKEQIYRVLQACGGRKRLIDKDGNSTGSHDTSRGRTSDLVIDCFYLDFDGKKIRPVPKRIIIQPYKGRNAITSLPAFPLEFISREAVSKVVERGKKFVRLVEVVHKKYKGLTIKEGDYFHNYEEVDGDVIIDFELAFRSDRPKIKPPEFGGGVITSPSDEDLGETISSGIEYDDPTYWRVLRSKFVNSTTLLDPENIGELGRDRWILLPYRVYGYALLSRRWFALDIDLVEDITPVKEGELDGFSDLILPEGHKDIVRALVITHARGTVTQENNTSDKREFDLVKGKGKGLIILLHGAPGVGKTSTAECVAANTGRPLFPITCGDIGGDSAQDVERNLESFFDLARKWGCVLLLDEADVFLAERMKGDIRQNSLVSVFLRILEYYSGILILTTNRVGEFDEAIKSRVHCALYYPPLSKDHTLKVWKLNLNRLDRQNQMPSIKIPIKFSRTEIMNFAKSHWKEGNRWNGRQIKNAFQTAVALADWDYRQRSEGLGERSWPLLTSSHFQKVSEASAHFDKYLVSVRASDQQRAKMFELRHDGFLYQLQKEQDSARALKAQKVKWVANPSSEESISVSETDDDTDPEIKKSVVGWKKRQGLMEQEQTLKALIARQERRKQRDASKTGKLNTGSGRRAKEQEQRIRSPTTRKKNRRTENDGRTRLSGKESNTLSDTDQSSYS